MKVRVRYSKLGKVRFVDNLDVTRIWERSLRKAALPGDDDRQSVTVDEFVELAIDRLRNGFGPPSPPGPTA